MGIEWPGLASVKYFVRCWWALEHWFFYAISLSLTVGPASVCDSHLGPLAVSVAPVCLGAAPQPFAAITSAGTKASVGLHAASALSPSLSCLHCSLRYAHIQMSQCTMSQTCLRVDQENLCWTITVQHVVTWRGETWRSHAAVLLASPPWRPLIKNGIRKEIWEGDLSEKKNYISLLAFSTLR